MIFLYIFTLFVSFYLLAALCEEYFVPSLDVISNRLHLSPDVAGATFMAVGSSAPELFISLFALIKPGNYENMGAGTIVGSAIFNVLVIIGASAAFKAAKLNWQPVIRDMLFYIISIILLLYAFWDGQFSFGEAGLFLISYIIYIGIVIKWKSWFPYEDANPTYVIQKNINKNRLSRISKFVLSFVIPDVKKYEKRYLLTFIMSILSIAVLSYMLVESGVALGEALQINPTIIALTVLAIGTSVPDLISSVIVAKQGRGDMAVSNAIGSNIFDILFGLGFPLFLILLFQDSAITVQTENLIGSIILLFATVAAILFLLIARKWRISRRAGVLLVALYMLYLLYNIQKVL